FFLWIDYQDWNTIRRGNAQEDATIGGNQAIGCRSFLWQRYLRRSIDNDNFISMNLFQGIESQFRRSELRQHCVTVCDPPGESVDKAWNASPAFGMEPERLI